MVFQIIILVVGLFCLYAGAEWLVGGSVRLACRYNVSPLVIGLTIVAFGTSAPELLVSLFASGGEAPGLSIGNVIGSNVINIALVLGLSILLNPMSLHRKAITPELMFMVGSSLLLWFLCLDGTIRRVDGLILAGCLALYLAYRFVHATSHDYDLDDYACANGSLINIAYIMGGTVILCAGAHLVVESAVALAVFFGLSNTFIGLSIVAFGTSLPELAASMVAARKMENDIAIGNVVGSNIFNACMVMGVVGLVSPIQVDKGLNYFEFPFMMCVSLLLLYLALRVGRLSRRHGLLFLVLFILYLIISWRLTGV